MLVLAPSLRNWTKPGTSEHWLASLTDPKELCTIIQAANFSAAYPVLELFNLLIGRRFVQQEMTLRYDSTVRLKELSAIRQFVEESVVILGGDQETSGELALVINEAVSNIILHGYHGRPGRIRIEIHRSKGQITIRLHDWAPLFDPTTVGPANINLPFDQRRFGGLGVHMMRELTDDLQYRLTPSGENELTVVKQLAA